MDTFTSYYNIKVQETGRKIHKNFQYLLPSQQQTDATDISDDEVIFQMTKETYINFRNFVDNTLILNEMINADPAAREMMDQLLTYLELKN